MLSGTIMRKMSMMTAERIGDRLKRRVVQFRRLFGIVWGPVLPDAQELVFVFNQFGCVAAGFAQPILHSCAMAHGKAKSMFWFRSEKKSGPATEEFQSNSCSFHVPEGVRATVDENGVVLFSLTAGKLFRANRTGARIWSAISQGKDAELLAQELSNEFGISVSRATEDISRFLQSLTRSELLTVAEPAR